jgi:hypothetical protein
MDLSKAKLVAIAVQLAVTPFAKAGSPSGDVVGKLVVGYQGWFSCEGDGSPVNRWAHQNLEMWPDVREYAKTYQTNHPNLGNGEPAKMFSAYDDQVVNTHFRWMAEYGIDCAALQRFANEIRPGSSIKAQRDGMAIKVMNAAQATGRKFYIMYDLSGWGLAGVQADWSDTIVNSLHLLSSPAYAKQNGKPVVSIYGMGYVRWPANAEDALKTVQWFKDQGCYVIGSVPGQWRSGNGDSRPDFEPVYSAFNMLSGWAVGRAVNPGYTRWVEDDFAYCNTHGIDYQPCIYPGTSFHNTNGRKKNQFPRNHGDFMWSQFATVKKAGVSNVYVAMFDELNEATSIFKCAEDTSMAPAGEWYVNLDADGEHCSSDFYLRLVNDAGKMLKGLIPYQEKHTTPFVVSATDKKP